MLVVGFDIETGSAKHLNTWPHSDDYLVLAGAIRDGEKATTSDFTELVRLLEAADLIYGHNILGFDIPALVKYAGAPWSLMDKAIDTMVWARHLEPPAPKGMAPVRYDLTSVAERLGVTTKTDDIKRLAATHLAHHIDAQLTELHTALAQAEQAAADAPPKERPPLTREANRIRREIRTRTRELKEPYAETGAFHLIPADDPELISYLEGDLDSSAAVFHEMRHLLHDPYCQREMRIMRRLHKMAHRRWRVNLDLLRERVKEEDQSVEEGKHRLSVLCPGLDPARENPVRTNEGLAAIETALKGAGVPHRDLPRTDTGRLATGRDALGTGDWVHKVTEQTKQWDPRGRCWRDRTAHRMVRQPGLRSLHPDNAKVQEICQLAVLVGGKVRKYRELYEAADEQGWIQSWIGDLQVSGRFGMVTPSVTNIGKRGDKQLAQREVFIARHEDEVLVSIDLDQGDMRVVAALSQDPAYMAMFAPGKDAHMENAFLVFGERTKGARKKIKAISHGVTYGMGVDSCVVNSGQPRDVVQHYFDVQEREFPVVMGWKETARTEAKTGLIADNGWGRPMRTLKSQAYTQGPALYGQSGTREILMDGVLRLPEEIADMMVAIVHDEIVFSVPRDRAAEITAQAVACVETTWRGVAFTCGVNGPAENWGACYVDD